MRENIIYLSSSSFDIGNTGANVAVLAIPQECRVRKVVASPLTAVANSFTVSVDSFSNGTQGAADIASIVVPDATAAGVGLFDKVAEGTKLEGGSLLLVQVDEAGDSGESAFVSIELEYSSENESNQSFLTETA